MRWLWGAYAIDRKYCRGKLSIKNPGCMEYKLTILQMLFQAGMKCYLSQFPYNHTFPKTWATRSVGADSVWELSLLVFDKLQLNIEKENQNYMIIKCSMHPVMTNFTVVIHENNIGTLLWITFIKIHWRQHIKKVSWSLTWVVFEICGRYILWALTP